MPAPKRALTHASRHWTDLRGPNTSLGLPRRTGSVPRYLLFSRNREPVPSGAWSLIKACSQTDCSVPFALSANHSACSIRCPSLSLFFCLEKSLIWQPGFEKTKNI